VIDMDRDIERAAHTLAEAAGSPVRVILFGSHARGEARAGSDLDFLVIEPHVPDRHAEMVRLRSALRGFRRPSMFWSTARPRLRSGARLRERRFMRRSPRDGCLSKRDEHEVASALIAKAVGDAR
jgi:predicted nucleotidyltransferase